MPTPPRNLDDNIYTRLGVTPIINALGTVTRLGGSIMPPEVVRAMQEAGQYFVDMKELNARVGERIAQLIGVEAATVTTGAAGSIAMATAACVAIGNTDRIKQLPDTTGMRNEVIVQKSHRTYEHQVLNVGAKLIEVQTLAQLRAAINERTAMLFFLNKASDTGQIDRATWIAVGKEFDVPTFNDAAADAPPVEHLSAYVKLGFDLVCFSGGKGLRGPQSSGLLLGRKDLIDLACAHGELWSTSGRGMKVGKEECMGLLAAVERFVSLDFDAEHATWMRRIAVIEQAMAKIDGVRTEIYTPPVANHVPHVNVEWEPGKIKLTEQQVSDALLHGSPRIEVAGHNWFRGGDETRSGLPGVTVSVWMLQDGEVQVIARQLGDVLRGKM